ncbi:NAD-binding protein [Arthrobacter cryoconiti]|uniref:NAD-binding protein n=1 Tax=Arthrobacter cryoconiti TaxID=748907 RepID=A0ABV8R136_9MICC|nr:NAD-binding protein [Arthrobacter cryoconiti]MCC9068607.1 hypothetical protein [Arthrobacter cryoconiti]
MPWALTTGSGIAPVTAVIPELDTALVVTPETVADLQTLPLRLTIICDGPIVCELGQALARLGSQVIMVARSGILPKEDPDAVTLGRKMLPAATMRNTIIV